MPRIEYHRQKYDIDVGAYKSNNQVTGMRVGIYPFGSSGEEQLPITIAPEGASEFRDLGQAYLNEVAYPGIGRTLQAAGLAHSVDRSATAETAPLYQFDCTRLYDIPGFMQYRDDWKSTFNTIEQSKTDDTNAAPLPGYFYKEEIDGQYSNGVVGERTPYKPASQIANIEGKSHNIITVPRSWATPLNRFDSKGVYQVLTGRTKVEMPPRPENERDLPGVFYVNNSQIYESNDVLHIDLGAGARVRFGSNREESWKPAKFISTVAESRLPAYMKEETQVFAEASEERVRVNQETVSVSHENSFEYDVDISE